jgi:DNA-binding response OmpR family regulator
MHKISTRILFIEDEAIVALLATRTMRAAGYSVARASTGEEALELFAQDNYDLVVSDVELGSGMDGIETAKRLLNEAPVPLLFLTSHCRAEVDGRATGIAGRYDYVMKGSDPSHLLDMIKLCLQRGDGEILYDFIEGKLGDKGEPRCDEPGGGNAFKKQREHLRELLRDFAESGKPYAQHGPGHEGQR